MQSTGQQRGLTGVWRVERKARWFFAAHLQGALGTGAGYVALLLLAYEQLGSAWGATAVLIADLAPAMLLGPVLGGLIDRTGRLRCAIAAELIGALAFAGLVFAHGTVPLIALALAAGLGSALLRPATCALLPAVVTPASLNAANGLFGAVREMGQLIGPAVAAGVLLFAEPELVLALNAVTFAASAVLMTRLRGHLHAHTEPQETDEAVPANLLGVLQDPFVRSLVLTSGAVMLVAGATNVAELVLASDQLGGGRSGFALLVAAFGCGMLTGSLLGPSDDGALRQRYLLAIALLGAGLIATAASPILPLAMLGFSVAGIGNGLFLVTVRVLMQKLIPEAAHGRAFGLLDAIDSWGFGAAIVAGGALAASLGGRATFAIAGALALLVFFIAYRTTSRREVHYGPQVVSTRPTNHFA
ncbi:MFS transporter [Solirubrobacter ginsenosidimutans]|uniref:MFS transporter n=1 Tax=Solirubrobacter ginsenosidimutans TaxID=490573 RepID=A0A9X3MZ32_9ACTN|nr:MFS transporter [Solirubrobacter ginsenosidimutans]MDA0162113.1 MFS transporter [Solirubrobacter ginsenosidimutans]